MTFIMFIHILSGTIAVLAGAIALIVKKGQAVHRKAGRAFFYSMIVTSIAGAFVAYFTPDQFIALYGGLLSLYLVVTSWMSAQKKDGIFAGKELAGLILISALAGILIWSGFEAQAHETGLKNGYSAGPYFFLGGISAFCALCDISGFARKWVNGKHRIARHLWRMCFAYFIAAGSLFTGPGASAFPKALRETGALSIPEPLILVVMLFWLVRTLVWNKQKKSSS